MPPGAKSFLQRWVVTTLGVVAAASILSGVHADTVLGLVMASLLLGILNAIIRPILMLLTLPLVVLTLGLFTLVINATLLYFVGRLVESFHVRDFWSAFFGGIIISLVSLAANLLIGKDQPRVQVRRTRVVRRDRRPPGGPGGPDTGSGPVIDV